jgi:hypothetical protein
MKVLEEEALIVGEEQAVLLNLLQEVEEVIVDMQAEVLPLERSVSTLSYLSIYLQYKLNCSSICIGDRLIDTTILWTMNVQSSPILSQLLY